MDNYPRIPRGEIKNGFANEEVVKDFEEKWKSLNFYLYSDNSSFRIGLKQTPYDWQNRHFYVRTDHGTLTFCQFPGFCGAVIVYSTLNYLFYTTNPLLEFAEDLFLKMGYTVLIVSEITERKKFSSVGVEHEKVVTQAPKYGFKPFLGVVNRRTDNEATMYYKHLLWK